ncbi:MAG: 16S rRNA (cytosine(967)-C(5))-methyltransferase RsmB [Clostridia bacterium]|nr:16S rRNA (cytosine(967)-C(5))-methyltransferase RsmB [Clostridia bacterium]
MLAEPTPKSARALALDLLCEAEARGQYPNIALDHALRRNPLSPADRALATTLVYGVTERRMTLDAIIDRLAAREIEPRVRAILRLGLYQLRYLDRIPAHAAVNESVALATRKSAGFVNAILRAYGRRAGEFTFAAADAASMAIAYSVAEPICAAFIEAFGLARAESIIAAFGRIPPLTLRVNTLRVSRDEYLARLAEAGIEASPCAVPSGIRLAASMNPTLLPGFDDGDCFVQDEASQRCVAALDAQPGELVLDLCACPGAKSFGAAIAMQNRGRVISSDLHANKLSLVASGAERLGISIIETAARDARVPVDELIGRADRVICDVPCSGLGVLGKKPDLRYKSLDDTSRLPAIQAAILETAAGYVRPGGRLVYSTCTILPAENEGVTAPFLAAHPEFAVAEERTLTPDVDGTDGFYYCAMVRV